VTWSSGFLLVSFAAARARAGLSLGLLQIMQVVLTIQKRHVVAVVSVPACSRSFWSCHSPVSTRRASCRFRETCVSVAAVNVVLSWPRGTSERTGDDGDHAAGPGNSSPRPAAAAVQDIPGGRSLRFPIHAHIFFTCTSNASTCAHANGYALYKGWFLEHGEQANAARRGAKLRCDAMRPS